METLTMVPRGPFSLAASIRFLEGFTPAAYAGPDTAAEDVALELAFSVEGSWQTVGVRVSQEGDQVTVAIVSPTSPDPELVEAVRAQVERILSLDVDGSAFAALGERDPVVGRLQRAYPGLRPFGFCSPYEAAAWTIIGHRIRIRQAAAIKDQMAKRLGEPVTFGDRAVHAVPPAPRVGRAVPGFPAAATAGGARLVSRAGRAQAGVAPVGRARRAGRAAGHRPAAR